jgi:hypothetical protein
MQRGKAISIAERLNVLDIDGSGIVFDSPRGNISIHGRVTNQK